MQRDTLFQRGAPAMPHEQVAQPCTGDCTPPDLLHEWLYCPRCGALSCFGHSIFMLGTIVPCERHGVLRCTKPRCKRFLEPQGREYVCAACGGADPALLAPTRGLTPLDFPRL